ncbi:hypothetical protein [Leptospira bandrabouensis]|uniref:hypothetical protein n=1 Tax=Leptospira bandrabouensis TaxID=2484903 RepID=UPI0010911C56|nr:hypothetical protein [Leptospira bandrabouensis]TGN08600.1 hypothetical protein EHR07_03530 [Leptospira bandrabouensis]
MRYITILALLFNCAVSSSDIKKTEAKKEKVRNSAVWGTEEDAASLSLEESIVFVSSNFSTINPYEKIQTSLSYYIHNGEVHLTTFLLYNATVFSISFDDNSRNELYNCLNKFDEWAIKAKKNNDEFRKEVCQIPMSMDFSFCKGNGNIKFSFDNTINSDVVLIFGISKTPLNGDKCNKEEFSGEDFRYSWNTWKPLVKHFSDELIKKSVGAVYLKKKKINATYK